MIIKKISDEQTYSKITFTTTVEVNGKRIRIYSYTINDPQFDIYEGDTEIDFDDYSKLTDQEKEEISDLMYEIYDWEDGQEEKIDDWDEESTCENCGNSGVWKNSSGEIQCNNCGYDEANDKKGGSNE